jgi:hypothetical protein
MPAAVPTRGSPSALRRLLRGLVLAALLLSPVLVVLLAVETEPRVTGVAPPDGVAAERAGAVAERLRDLMDGGDVAAGWGASEEEVNAVLASAGRLLPGLVGRARIDDERAAVELSLGGPPVPAGLWANLHLGFAESEEGLEIASARIGRLPLPPALAEGALRLALDRALGDGVGAAAFDSVGRLTLEPGAARVGFRIGQDGEVALLEMMRHRARGAAGSDARQQARIQLWYLDRAVREGRLPRDGSVVAYLRFVIEIALREAGPERERVRGALYALAVYCGDPAFETVVGVSLPGRMQGRANGCAGTTLGGRDDLRKHFVISAGLHAATSGTAAFGMGELKELVDSTTGGSGFSFDDMAADAAGVRFSQTFLAAPPPAWPGLAARIVSEEDVLPSLAGLPIGLTAEEFEARYGTVESDAYARLVAEIDRRVAALPLHATARF